MIKVTQADTARTVHYLNARDIRRISVAQGSGGDVRAWLVMADVSFGIIEEAEKIAKKVEESIAHE